MRLIITTIVKLRLNLLNLLRQTFSVIHNLNCFYQKYTPTLLEDLMIYFLGTLLHSLMRLVGGLWALLYFCNHRLYCQRERGGRKREGMERKDA